MDDGYTAAALLVVGALLGALVFRVTPGRLPSLKHIRRWRLRSRGRL